MVIIINNAGTPKPTDRPIIRGKFFAKIDLVTIKIIG
jgi:hypothetical protein